MINTSDATATVNINPSGTKDTTNISQKKKHHHTRKSYKHNGSKPHNKGKKWDTNHSEKNTDEQEPYVVIVKNAENDLSKIHHEALPLFLGLNKNQIKKQVGSSFYDLKIRSETRTAEISFFGSEEEKYFKTFVAHQKWKENKLTTATGEKRHRSSDAVNPVDKETTTHIGENDEEDNKQSHPTNDGVTDCTEGIASPKYASVRDMLHAVSVKDYFYSPLQYNLLAIENDEEEIKTARKDSGDTVQETDNGKDDLLDNVKYITSPSCYINGKLESQQDTLVTSIADTNIKCTPKHIRKVLADVPGFVSAWFLRSCGPNSSTFRVVFASMERLFAAKEILDQFGADRDMKVTLKLSDNHESKFREYLVKKAAAEL